MSDDSRTVVLLGNPNPQMQVKGPDGKQISAPAAHLPNGSSTHVEMRPGFDDPEHVTLSLSTNNDRLLSLIAGALGDEHRSYAVGVREIEDVLGVHSAGVKPSWVASNDPAFAAALAAHFGCPTSSLPTLLQTHIGRDDMHKQQFSTTTVPAAFNYGALSANTGGSFVNTDTTLAGEITTASGGLIRQQMTFAHTTGTNTSTLTATWTANGSDSLPVTVKSWAVFNQATSGGDMGYEDALSASSTLNVSGDNLTATFTGTLG